MNTNAMQAIILPILLGLLFGSALGAVGLAIVRAIDGLAGQGGGKATGRDDNVPAHPAGRWRTAVEFGPGRAGFEEPSRRAG